MSAANGLNPGNLLAAKSALRRCAGNIMAALRMVLRRPRNQVGGALGLAWQQIAFGAAAALAIFLLTLVLFDAAAITAVKQLPSSVVWFFEEITDFGKSGWFLWPLGILFLVLAALAGAAPRTPQVLAAVMVRVGFLFAAIALPGIFVNVVKHVVGRARPMVGGSLDPFLFSPFSWPAAYAGLPSGHATTAFSVLVAFGTLWPRARAVLWIYALIILASRVVVNAHYPSDVLAGALVGTVGALMVRRYFALRGLGFTVGPDARVRPMAGPSLDRVKAVARELLGP